MPLFPHFPLWCDECFAYAYWVSGSNAKPSLAICFPFAFGTRTIACWHRIGSRVGFRLRLWGCASKPVHGCVGVLLHATPQLSSAGDACRCYAAVPPLRWLTHHLQSYPRQHGSQNHSIVALFYRFLTLGVCMIERSWACVNKVHSITTNIMNKTSQIISAITSHWSFIHRSASVINRTVMSMVYFKQYGLILPWARQWRSSWAGLGYAFEYLCESRATIPHQAQPGSTSRLLHLPDGWGLHACRASVLAHSGLHTPPRQRDRHTHMGFPGCYSVHLFHIPTHVFPTTCKRWFLRGFLPSHPNQSAPVFGLRKEGVLFAGQPLTCLLLFIC